jgi:hypothetical protein
MNRIRVNTPAAVEQMAAVNHAELTRTPGLAAVTLADVTYFWAAA